jgi:hypothetical protein
VAVKARGPALVEALVKYLAGPKSPIGDPHGLSADAIRAAEDAAGVALSPSMAALLAFDVGWAERELSWFAGGALQARPTAELIGDRVGPYRPVFDAVCARRFPGRALLLDDSGEAGRLVYLGDPDEFGEYPVLFWDIDDNPLLGVEDAGFDTWLGRRIDLLGARAFAADTKATSKRLFGRQTPLELDLPAKKLGAPVAGPPPGSVAHPAIAVAPARKPRRLTDAQVAKSLAEQAVGTNAIRLGELIAEAKARGLPRSALDDALAEAAREGPLAAVLALLAAGASPNARGRSGCALARAAWNDDDRVTEALLAAGADPNGPSILGQTALHEIVQHGKTTLVRAYLAAGADPSRRDQYGHTPLHHTLVAPVGRALPPAEIVTMLAPRTPLAGSPPLVVAAVEGATAEHLRLLLAAGADPNATSEYLHRTALHAAFDQARDDLAPMLVAAGADREAMDDRGIALSEIYGPAGEDVRPITVAYAPSAEPQVLDIALTIAVVNEYHAAKLAKPSLQGRTWSQLAATGLLGGGAIAVRTEADFSGLTTGGFHTVALRLALTDVGPELVTFLLAMMLADTAGLRTGAGYDPIARVVGIAATGSAAGASAVSPARVRAVARTPWIAFDGEPTPAIHGARPGIRATFPHPPTADELAAFETACRAWFGTHAAWEPRTIDRPSAWMLEFGAPTAAGSEAFLRLVEFSGAKRPGQWPWIGPAPLVAFAQVAASFPVPLELVLPESA